MHAFLTGTDEPEVDGSSDMWIDWQLDIHTPEVREAPEGYTYTCCERAGDEPGCKRFRHVVDLQLQPAKRRKPSQLVLQRHRLFFRTLDRHVHGPSLFVKSISFARGFLLSGIKRVIGDTADD